MTTIAIAGGHGTVALHLTRTLTDRGHTVRSLVRDPDHQQDVESAGGEMHIVDLEETSVEDIARVLKGCDAVVFAAGSGPGSGAERKLTVDRDGAIRMKDAALQAGVDRYVMVSSMGTDDPPEGDDVFEVYLRAKAAADEAVMASDLQWTILRPGGLTDDPGTGTVAIDRHVDRGEVTREDVATVLAGLLERPGTAGKVLELVGGDTPVDAALDAVA